MNNLLFCIKRLTTPEQDDQKP